MLTIMQMTIRVSILLFISFNLLRNQKIIGLSDCRTTPKVEVATNKMTKNIVKQEMNLTPFQVDL